MSESPAGSSHDPNEKKNPQQADDAAGAGAESPEEGAAAMDDAEDAVIDPDAD